MRKIKKKNENGNYQCFFQIVNQLLRGFNLLEGIEIAYW